MCHFAEGFSYHFTEGFSYYFTEGFWHVRPFAKLTCVIQSHTEYLS